MRIVEGSEDELRAVIRGTVDARSFLRLAAIVRRTSVRRLHSDLLVAILAVEMSARPRWIRGIEWAVYWAGRLLRISKRRLPRTRGPLQLPDAPFPFVKAVHAAEERIVNSGIATNSIGCDLQEVARLWHGASTRQPGEAFAYVDALRAALVMTESVPDVRRWDSRWLDHPDDPNPPAGADEFASGG